MLHVGGGGANLRMVFQGFAQRDPLSVVFAGLSEEFSELFDRTIIERVAAEEVATFEGARVREFIPILALRRGRARLRMLAHPGGHLRSHHEVTVAMKGDG